MENFFLACIFMFISCNANPVCNSKIEIDKIVLDNASVAGVNYCKMVNSCLEGDIESIREMFLDSKDYLDAGSLYLHFNYIYQITKEIGEDRFIEITSELTKQEVEQLYFSIDLGVETLGNGSTLGSEFPKLYKILWNNTEPKFKKV